MKKVVIVVSIIIIILIGALLIFNSKKNLKKALSQFETSQSDEFYDVKTHENASGYIVSNKTTEGYRYGYVNYKGDILLEAEYNQLYRVMQIDDKDKVYIIAAKDGRYGVSLNGKVIINYEYQFISYNSDVQIFILQKSDKYGVANTDGDIIIPVENEAIEARGKYIYVTNQGEKSVYNKNGKIQEIDFNTSINATTNENYYIKIVTKGDQYFYGIVDKDENELVAANYTYIEYLFDDYFIACNQTNKQGIIDKDNNIKLSFDYDLVQKIQNTNIIRTLNINTEETELYSKSLEKIYMMKNATIENDGNTIKIYNEETTKYFDKNGIEIEK